MAAVSNYVSPYLQPTFLQTDFGNTGQLIRQNLIDKRNRQEKAYNQTSAFYDSLASADVYSGDLEMRDKIVEDFKNQVNEVVETKYQGDWAKAAPEVTQLIIKARSNPFWNESSLTRKRQLANQEAIDKARLEGKTVYDFGAEQGSSYNPYTKEYGNVQFGQQVKFDDSKVRIEQESIFDQMNGDYFDTKSKLEYETITDPKTGQKIEYPKLVNKKGDALTVNKVTKYAENEGYDRYRNTDIGEQRFNVLTKIDGYTDEQAERIIKDELIAVGKEKLYNNVRTNEKAFDGGGSKYNKNSLFQPVGVEGIDTEKNLNTNGKILDNYSTTPRTPEQKVSQQIVDDIVDKDFIKQFGLEGSSYNDVINKYKPDIISNEKASNQIYTSFGAISKSDNTGKISKKDRKNLIAFKQALNSKLSEYRAEGIGDSALYWQNYTIDSDTKKIRNNFEQLGQDMNSSSFEIVSAPHLKNKDINKYNSGEGDTYEEMLKDENFNLKDVAVDPTLGLLFRVEDKEGKGYTMRVKNETVENTVLKQIDPLGQFTSTALDFRARNKFNDNIKNADTDATYMDVMKDVPDIQKYYIARRVAMENGILIDPEGTWKESVKEILKQQADVILP